MSHAQVWEFLQPHNRRQAPPLWWTAPPPQSANQGPAHVSLAVSQKAASINQTAAAGARNRDKGRAKPAKPSAALTTSMPAAHQPQPSAPKRSCAAAEGAAVMSAADLESWLAGPPPEEAEDDSAGGQAPVSRLKRQSKPVKVRSVYPNAVLLHTIGSITFIHKPQPGDARRLAR